MWLVYALAHVKVKRGDVGSWGAEAGGVFFAAGSIKGAEGRKLNSPTAPFGLLLKRGRRRVAGRQREQVIWTQRDVG